MNRMLNTMLLGAAAITAALSAAADYVREDELTVAIDMSVASDAAEPSDYETIDLRTTFPVESLESKALKGLMYSANGWARNATEDATRTATITARAGTLANGFFMSDVSAEVTVAAGLTGEGSVNWNATKISKKVYQLTHTAQKGGTVDAAGTCYGYLDFTHCVVSRASQAEVEAAVLGEITHKITVTQDEDWPWQPVDSAAVRSGIVTDEGLEPDKETATTFAFKGRGVLRYEYYLTGGELDVVADGETVLTFAEPTGWTAGQVAFEGYGTHEVVFAYTAADDGLAAIRNVRWEELDGIVRAAADNGEPVPVDLQEGVRTPRYLVQVLPFEYSSTNWIGDVANVSAASVAQVTVVRLTGTDPDVRTWTDEVPGTFKELVKQPGEAAVRWRPRQGVWKATFDILNDDASLHRETALFDLRNARSFGFVLIVK